MNRPNHHTSSLSEPLNQLEKMKHNITSSINNKSPEYKENMQELSKIYVESIVTLLEEWRVSPEEIENAIESNKRSIEIERQSINNKNT